MIGEVERQARILDHITPGWEHRINPDTLTFKGDGRSPSSLITDCVLGQVYGAWGDQPRGVRRNSSAYLGMCLFGKKRWIWAAQRRINYLRRIRALDLRTDRPLYVPNDWQTATPQTVTLAGEVI
jgi:hypothetical protein